MVPWVGLQYVIMVFLITLTCFFETTMSFYGIPVILIFFFRYQALYHSCVPTLHQA